MMTPRLDSPSRFTTTLNAVNPTNRMGEDRFKNDANAASNLESWDEPQLIPLDLGSAQGKYCAFNNESAPDNGPLTPCPS